jgi:hypothetical protein
MPRAKGSTTPSLAGNRRREVNEALFELKFVKNIETWTIWSERESFIDFWKKWENFNKMGYKFDDLYRDEVRDYAYKSLNNLIKNFYRDKKYKQRMEDIKRRRNMGAQALDVMNQVLLSETKQEVIFDDDGREVGREVVKTITAKKIERIEFASEITIRAMETIGASQDMVDEWLKDYKTAIDCANNNKEYNGKYKFYHLELAAKFKKIALDLADVCHQTILTGDIEEVRTAEARMRAAMKIAEMMEKIKETEAAPLRLMNLAHEGGERRQKEMMVAINNDRQMVEFGNIVLKEEKNVVDRHKMREKLKEQGYSKIQDLLTAELKNVGAIEDIEEEIKNPTIIDIEEDEFKS